MQRLYYLLFVLLALSSINCQKEISFTNPGPTITHPVTATVQGNVVDENDNPAVGVTIKIGSKTAITDAKGYFRIKNASLDKYTALVTAEKTGYFKTFRVFSASSVVNQVAIKLIRKTLAGSLNTTAGGEITVNGGSKIIFNANSFVNASGNAYSGPVNIYAAYIDPTAADIGQTVPGSFLADDKNGKRVILSSFGMMSVIMESPAGEKLLLRSGHQAKLNFAIPSTLLASAPASISLWYVDEQSGLWKEEGTAVKTGNSYEGFVSHFTYWNCDVPGDTVNLTATFVNQNAQPLVYVPITVRPLTGYGTAHGYTDSLGQINGPIPANMPLVLEVMSPCNTVIYSQNIGPYSTHVNLGTITVPNSGQFMVTVTGKLVNCSNAPVTNGYALIHYDNFTRYAGVNNSGDFSTTYIACTNSPATCEVVGVDNAAQQQGTPIVVPVTLPITNTGSLAACGTSTLQYINYTLDGINHSISTATGDSLTSYTADSMAVKSTWIWGTTSGSWNTNFHFNSNGNAGTYPLLNLSVDNYPYATLLPPFDVTITNFPPNAGGFYEGSFSGQFKDASNTIHTISSTFRVRRD